MARLAMFPLGMVLMPGGVLPLHVFEPRYREMIVDCLSSDGAAEFGQVLITHGSEAGGGDQRAMVGTVAQMVRVEALDGDRYSLVTVGTRRIRIIAWLADNPYPTADVEDWPDEYPDGNDGNDGDDGDDGDDGADLRDAVTATHSRVRAALVMAAQLGDVSADLAEAEITHDVVQATYDLASLAPIGPADRLRLLSAPGPSDRLAVFDEVLDDLEAALRFRLS